MCKTFDTTMQKEILALLEIKTLIPPKIISVSLNDIWSGFHRYKHINCDRLK